MKINPCPKCKSKDIYRESSLSPLQSGVLYWLKCNLCRHMGPVKGSDKEAIKAWNEESNE